MRPFQNYARQEPLALTNENAVRKVAESCRMHIRTHLYTISLPDSIQTVGSADAIGASSSEIACGSTWMLPSGMATLSMDAQQR